MSVNIEISNFQDKIIDESKKRLVVVDFWAEWCEPCKTLAPILEKLEIDFKDKFLLAKVDTEANSEIASQLQIQSIPTVMFFYEADLVDKFSGVLSEEEIKKKIEKYIPDDELTIIKKLIKNNKLEKAEKLLIEKDFKEQENATLLWDLSIKFLEQEKLERGILKSKELLKLLPEMDNEINMKKKHLLNFLAKDNSKEMLKRFVKIFDEQEQENTLNSFLDEFSKGNKSAKETIILFFHILGNSNPLTIQYRKKLSRLLY